jgi:hypothetical protein
LEERIISKSGIKQNSVGEKKYSKNESGAIYHGKWCVEVNSSHRPSPNPAKIIQN